MGEFKPSYSKNTESIQNIKFTSDTITTKTQEQLWKRQLIEHDIRL